MPNPVKAMFDAATQTFPPGTVAAGFLLTLTEQLPPPADGVPSPDPRVIQAGAGLDDREIVIDDVAPGTYRGRIALVDADGAELAPGVEDPALLVITEASSVSLPVPSSLSLTRP